MQQLHTKAWLCGLCAQMIMSSAPDCEIAVIKEVPKEAAARTPTQKRQSPLRRFHEGTLTFTFGVFGACEVGGSERNEQASVSYWRGASRAKDVLMLP